MTIIQARRQLVRYRSISRRSISVPASYFYQLAEQLAVRYEAKLHLAFNSFHPEASSSIPQALTLGKPPAPRRHLQARPPSVLQHPVFSHCQVLISFLHPSLSPGFFLQCLTRFLHLINTGFIFHVSFSLNLFNLPCI